LKLASVESISYKTGTTMALPAVVAPMALLADSDLIEVPCNIHWMDCWLAERWTELTG